MRGKVEDACDNAAASAPGIGKAVGDDRKLDETAAKTKRVTPELDKIRITTERLRNVQSNLGKRVGDSVSVEDALRFLENFDRMWSPGGLSSPRQRKFGSFEEWDAGLGSTFRSQDNEALHRR